MSWTDVKHERPKCSKDPDALGVPVLIWPRNPQGEEGRGIDGHAYYGRRATGRPEFYKYGAPIHGVTHWMPLPENDMEQGYYGEIKTPREAIYEAACALDNQDVPLEDWPVKLIAALARAGFAVVPVELPHDALGRAAIAGVAETGNPKHAWDFLIAATRAA